MQMLSFINNREYRSGNQKRTIQRNWQHRVHMTKKKKPQHNMSIFRTPQTRVYMMEQWIVSCHDSSFVFHNIKHILLSSTLWCILLFSKTLNQFVSSTLWCLLLLSKTLYQFVSSTRWCILLFSKTLNQFMSSTRWCILLFSETLYQFVSKTLWCFLLMLLISVYFRFCMKFGDHVLTLCIQNRG